MILRLCVLSIFRLKMHWKSLVYVAQCQVLDWTPQNKSGPSKLTPLAEDTWLRAKNCPQ